MSYPNEVHRLATIAEIGRSGIFLGAIVLPVWLIFRGAKAWARADTPSTIRRELLLVVFVVYVVGLGAATIFPLSMSSFSGTGSVSLVPGLSTYRCFTHKGDTPAEELIFCFQNLIGNVVLFIPMGLMLPLVSRRFRSIRSFVVAIVAISGAIEVVQFAERFLGTVRSVDIDDVILNLTGACIGYAVIRLLVALRGIGTGERLRESAR